jgi:hypothetical protein
MRDYDKNEKLKDERWISFEDVIECIATWSLLAIKNHENIDLYPNQKRFIINYGGYIYYVPFEEIGEKKFLRTIIPSRKLMKEYL